MVSSLILLSSLRVYILKQLFFSISVNSGFGNIYLAAFAARQIFGHYSPRFQRIIVNCKWGISKIDGHHYSFEYVSPEDIPVDYKKSANIRPRKYTIHEKKQMQNLWYKEWAKKVYNCPRCCKSIKNGSKYFHNKVSVS